LKGSRCSTKLVTGEIDTVGLVTPLSVLPNRDSVEYPIEL